MRPAGDVGINGYGMGALAGRDAKACVVATAARCDRGRIRLGKVYLGKLFATFGDSVAVSV